MALRVHHRLFFTCSRHLCGTIPNCPLNQRVNALGALYPSIYEIAAMEWRGLARYRCTNSVRTSLTSSL